MLFGLFQKPAETARERRVFYLPVDNVVDCRPPGAIFIYDSGPPFGAACASILYGARVVALKIDCGPQIVHIRKAGKDAALFFRGQFTPDVARDDDAC